MWKSVFMASAMGQFNPLNSNSNTPERSFIEIPRMNLDINVTCAGREIVITIDDDYIQRNMKWLNKGNELSLADKSCKAVVTKDGNRMIKVRDDFTKCKNKISTESTENEFGEKVITSYKISNKLIHDDKRGVVERQIDLLEFDCVYPATQMTSQFMQPWLKSAAHEEMVKDLAGQMMLYKDANYTEPYMSPPTLTLDDDLYIQIELEKPLITNVAAAQSEIAVVMEDCWGTPTSDRSGLVDQNNYGAQLKYYMIKDRCPVEDPSLIIESNGNGLRSKFQIKMFKFIGEELNDVWLHCTVRACNATNPDNCIPDCGNNRSKRSLKKNKKKKLWYVSGPHELTTELPIQRAMNQAEIQDQMNLFLGKSKTSILEPGTTPFKVLLGVGAVITGLSLVMTVACVYVKRRAAVMEKFGHPNGGMVPGAQDVIYANTMHEKVNVHSSSSSSGSSSRQSFDNQKSPLKK